MFPGVGYLTFGFMATHSSRTRGEIIMDPNVALQQLRAAMRNGEADLAHDLFEELDEWLSRGGFLPAAWNTRVTESHPLPDKVDQALSELKAVIAERLAAQEPAAQQQVPR
jgi:hypothetical protein